MIHGCWNGGGGDGAMDGRSLLPEDSRFSRNTREPLSVR